MNAGKANYWFGRIMLTAGRVIQPLNFFMLIYLTAQNEPLVWMLLPGSVVCCLAWVWFDRTFIVEKEMHTWFNLNPQLVEMRNDIKLIKSKMEADGK